MLEKHTLYLSCLILNMGMIALDNSYMLLPQIAQQFFQANHPQLFISIYLLGFALSQLVSGVLCDAYGLKRTLIGTLLLMIIGNLLTSSANQLWTLLISRFIAGLGAGGCPTISRALLLRKFKERIALSTAFTRYELLGLISPALTPLLSGFILSFAAWQTVYLLTALLFSMILLFVVFIFHQPQLIKASAQLSIKPYLQILRNRHFLLLNMLAAILYAYTVFFFQSAVSFSHSYLHGAKLLLVYTFGLGLGAIISRRLLVKLSPNFIINSGIAFLLLCMLYCCYHEWIFISNPAILLFSITLSIVCGILAPLLTSEALYLFLQHAGVASSLQGFMKMSGAALILMLLHSSKPMSSDISIIYQNLSLLLLLTWCIRLFMPMNSIPSPRSIYEKA